MRKLTQTSGFTLLEIIIVIIIVGVLASLALPRFFSTVEYSRSTEALAAMSAVRQAMERCYLQRNATYVGCTAFGGTLDLEDPGTAPNAHFSYTIPSATVAGYEIRATRTTRDGGLATSIISLTQTTAAVQRSGASAFAGIK